MGPATAATAPIIQAQPFSLGAVRPWSPYEVAVIHQALLDGAAGVSPSAQQIEATRALALAVAAAPSFGSPFGPGPAVPVNWFYCLGKKWAENRLDPGLVGAVRSGSATAASFSSCDSFAASGSYADLFRHNDLQPWYGAVQRTSFMQPPDAVSELRSRTQYVATTGKQLLALLQRLTSFGGARIALPAQLQQMIDLANSAPASLMMSRPITLAVAVRDPAGLQTLLDIAAVLLPMVLAQVAAQTGTVTLPPQAIEQLRQTLSSYIEDIVMIWSPGQGASLMPIVMGTVDPTALIGIGAAMGFGVPAGLPPQAQDAIAGAIGAVTGILFPQQGMRGLESHTGPTKHPMATKTRAQLIAEALPPPPLPSGIVPVRTVSVTPGDVDTKKTVNPVAIGAAAVVVLLA